jgi:hypothetical protein
MSHSIAPVQQANPQAAAAQAPAAPKPAQNGAATAAPQDKVTISEASKQALANASKPAAGD